MGDMLCARRTRAPRWGPHFLHLRSYSSDLVPLETRVPLSVPAGWCLLDREQECWAWLMDRRGLRVMASISEEADGRDWLHVSLSYADRLPDYSDLLRVKETFIGRERTALQVFAPHSRRRMERAYCLHLYACLDAEALPDFAPRPAAGCVCQEEAP